MNSYQKFSVSFVLALALHLTILAFFGISFEREPEIITAKPLPEIIQASLIDDEKIQQEALRLKQDEKNKQFQQQKQQKDLEDKLNKENKRLAQAKQQRIKEELKASALKKKTEALAIKEKQAKDKLKKQQAVEVARKAKIKKQQVAEEKKRQEKLLAEQARQKAILAKQQAEAQRQQALLDQKATAEAARIEQDKQAVISAENAIQQKVIQRWIKPMSSAQGLSSTIRVKLLPSGDVMDVSVVKSSGDSVFDRSAENAVRKASPLPVPKSRALFSKRFRLFTFKFKPE